MNARETELLEQLVANTGRIAKELEVLANIALGPEATLTEYVEGICHNSKEISASLRYLRDG